MWTRRKLIGGAALFTPALIIHRASAQQLLTGFGRTNVPPTPSPFSNSDIPSVLNRPVLSGSILTWVGPLGGGPNNSIPVQQTRTLTASGSVTTTGTSQTIQGLNISGSITVAHNNTTIKQCRVKNPTANDSSGGFQISVNSGVINTIIEDCELDGAQTNGSNGGGGNISGFQFSVDTATVRRNNLHNNEQCIRYHLNNISFTDNWCNHVIGIDSDMFECYPVGSNVNNNTINHNCFDGTVQTGFLNSGINFTNGFSGTAGNVGPNNQVTNNFFLNSGEFFAICDDNSQGTGTVSWTAVNNGFYITNGGRERRDGTTITTNSGNYNMATVTSQSGTPSNGSGQL